MSARLPIHLAFVAVLIALPSVHTGLIGDDYWHRAFFLVHVDEGFYAFGTEILYRRPQDPMPVGTIVRLSDVSVTITHTLEDGVPDEARFVLGKGERVEDEFLFVAWKEHVLRPCVAAGGGQHRRVRGAGPAAVLTVTPRRTSTPS